MKSFGNAVVKARHLILILAFVLLVPAVWGYTHTRVNYDILTYLPDSIETIKGQDRDPQSRSCQKSALVRQFRGHHDPEGDASGENQGRIHKRERDDAGHNL